MALNLSAKTGPSGKRVLGLKGFSASAPAALAASAPNLSTAPLGASGETYPHAIGPQPLQPVWVWLRRKVIVIRKALPGVIGVGDAIRQRALAAGYSELEINKALRLHFRSRRYAEACAKEGAIRHNIDGEPVGALTDDERQWFQLRLARWTPKKKSAPQETAPAAPTPSENPADEVRANG